MVFLSGKNRFTVACIALALPVILIHYSCSRQPETAEALSLKYCGGCHVVPSPQLLPKHIWRQSVMPQMRFRMGLQADDVLAKIPFEDLENVLASIPATPMLSEEEFSAIESYYVRNAPDSLPSPRKDIDALVQGFMPIRGPASITPYISMLEYDQQSGSIFVGMRSGHIFRIDRTLRLVDSLKLSSTPADVTRGDALLITEMGIMDPNDQYRGNVSAVDLWHRTARAIVDSLKRPVFTAVSDLNGDQQKDLVICGYGNFSGQLLVMESLVSEHSYRRHTLSELGGARKAVIHDFNNDQRPDIMVLMAQGDEKISIYFNKGHMRFEEKIIVRFPPVYGSNSFELMDFNLDGFSDILFTNGDNADFSNILKPYHAVRIFINDGKNNFIEQWSYPMYGASQAKAADFDADGDIDIAAISYFPDYRSDGQEAFLYFVNEGNYVLTPHTVPVARTGRWLVLETADYDKDGDQDILLGAFNLLSVGNIDGRQLKSFENGPGLLVLKNAGKK